MSEIPDWIVDDSNEQGKRNAAKIIERGAEFYLNVVSRLEVNAKYLPKTGAQGRVSYLSKPGERELRCRLDMRADQGSPAITYSDLLHTVGSRVIQYRPSGAGACDFQLCILDDGEIGVVADGRYDRMTAEKFADWIAESTRGRLRQVA